MTRYKLIHSWEAGIRPAHISTREQTHEFLEKLSTFSDGPWKTNVAHLCEMPFFEETVAVLFWFIFFSTMLYFPFIFLYLSLYERMIAFRIFIVMVIIVFLPTNFYPQACYDRSVGKDFLNVKIA